MGTYLARWTSFLITAAWAEARSQFTVRNDEENLFQERPFTFKNVVLIGRNEAISEVPTPNFPISILLNALVLQADQTMQKTLQERL